MNHVKDVQQAAKLGQQSPGRRIIESADMQMQVEIKTCKLLSSWVGTLEGGQGRVHSVQAVTQLRHDLMAPAICPKVRI